MPISIIRSFKEYNHIATTVSAKRKALNTDVKKIASATKGIAATDQKTTALKGMISDSAKHLNQLNKKIKKLETFFSKHRIIHFFANSCLGRFSVLNKAIRERKIFNTAGTQEFRDEVKNKITAGKPGSQPHTEDSASEHSTSSETSVSEEKPATPPEEKKPTTKRRAQSENLKKPAKDTPKKTKSSDQTAGINPDKFVKDLPGIRKSSDTKKSSESETGSSTSEDYKTDPDLKFPGFDFLFVASSETIPVLQTLTPSTFPSRIAVLFTEEDQEAASELATQVAENFPEVEEQEKATERLNALASSYGTIHLNRKNPELNKQFMEAILLGNDHPASFITGIEGENLISDPVIMKEQILKKLVFINDEDRANRIADLFIRNPDDEKQVDIHRNIMSIKLAIQSGAITTVKPVQDTSIFAPLRAFVAAKKPVQATPYFSEEDIANAITDDEETFKAKFGLKD